MPRNLRCPVCADDVYVKETRSRADGMTYRRYACVNEHRFSTKEVIERIDETPKPRGTSKPDFSVVRLDMLLKGSP